MNFTTGNYATKNGSIALIRRTVQTNGGWYLRGAITLPGSSLYVLGYWQLNGECVTDAEGSDRFDLVRAE